MNNPEKNEWLDKELSKIIRSEKIKPDFEQWKKSHKIAVQILTSKVSEQTKSAYSLTESMKFPFLKLAAILAVIIGLLVIIFFSATRHNPDSNLNTQEIVSLEGNDEIKLVDSENLLEEGLLLAQKLFENNDIHGLSMLLNSEFEPVQVQAAEYLSKIGNETVLAQLHLLASKWDGPQEENVFALAFSSIEKRIYEPETKIEDKIAERNVQNIQQPAPEIVTQPTVEVSATSEETKKIFTDILNILNNMQHPYTGKGIAISHFSGTSVTESNNSIEFVFKDGLYKAAVSPMHLNGLFYKRSIFINNMDSNFLIGTDSASGQISVLNVPVPSYKCRIGYDFNPYTFMSYHEKPLKEYIQELLDSQSILSSTIDTEGLLHLVSDYEDDEYKKHRDISLDPANGYRLCRLSTSNEYLGDPAQKTTEQLEIFWKKYQSSWYITNASFWSSNETKLPDGMEKEKLVDENRIDVEIQEFTPNLQVDDSEFTVEGLGLPEDTRQ